MSYKSLIYVISLKYMLKHLMQEYEVFPQTLTSLQLALTTLTKHEEPNIKEL